MKVCNRSEKEKDDIRFLRNEPKPRRCVGIVEKR